jgi:hypothetical protein
MDICKYCDSKFASKKSLNHHQKNAKYCLDNQNQSENEKILRCDYCNKSFTNKKGLTGHKEECLIQKVIYNEKEILELRHLLKEKDNHIKELECKIENIAIKAMSRPTMITDNRVQQVINNLIPISDDYLKEQARYLTLDHVKQGPLGYATFACDYALKDRITCVDFARRKIKYKNIDGQIILDPEMTVLSKKLFIALEEKNTELIQEYKNQLRDMIISKYRSASDDMNETETKELDFVIEQINKDMQDISNLYYQTKEMAEGKKPDIYHDFIREVCNKMVY